MMAELQQFQCFTPIYRADCQLLIIGSLPGEMSFAQSQYYAHPSNDFWRLIGSLLGRDLDDLDYAERLEILLQARIGLWDSIRIASRRRSDDNSVRHAEINNLADIASRLGALQCIAFNGKTAAAYGRRGLADKWLHQSRILPSSSGAARLTFGAKLAAWRGLRDFIHLDPEPVPPQVFNPGYAADTVPVW